MRHDVKRTAVLWDASNVAQLSPKDITREYIKILMIQQHINNSVLALICWIVTAEADKKELAIENAKLLIDLTQIPWPNNQWMYDIPRPSNDIFCLKLHCRIDFVLF